MTGNDNKKWLTEYEAFLNAEGAVVPGEATQNVFSRMRELLNPSAWAVFLKIVGIHIVIGFLSLSVCHQFGINPFGTARSLADWFMEMWGHSACMVGCGVLFVGLSVLSAGYFLTIEEVRALRQTEFLQILALSFASLLLFAGFGAELALTFAGLWLLGALVGGCLAAEAVWKLKRVRI